MYINIRQFELFKFVCTLALVSTDDGVDGGESSYVSLVRSPLPQLCQQTVLVPERKIIYGLG